MNDFLYKLNRLANFTINPKTNCWEWKGRLALDGYARVSIHNRPRPVHQVAWELYNNQPFPEGLVSRHLCNNRKCMNPEHIKPGTQKENMHDKWEAGTIHTGDRNGQRTKPEKTARGCRSGGAKLDKAGVFAVLTDLKNGLSSYDIEDKYGFSHSAVRDLRNERSYIVESAEWKLLNNITGSLGEYLRDKYIHNKRNGRPPGSKTKKKVSPSII